MPASLMTADQVRDLIRDACKADGSQRAFAVRVGVSAPHVSQLLAGQREPGEAILAALGLRRVVAYSAA